ncbi:MAG TPA: ATP-binding protein [Rectinemataceae bacterium]|nr:ATP-binding protein [Rectinemataceae bacterium]
MEARRSVRSRILISSLVSSLIVIIAFVGAIAALNSRAFAANIQAKTDMAVARLAKSLAIPLWSYDIEACNGIIKSELDDRDFGAIFLREVSGNLLSGYAWSGRDLVALKDEASLGPQLAASPIARGTSAITYHETKIGEVRIYATGLVSLRALEATIIQQALFALLLGGLIALLAFLAADRLISKRVLALGEELGRFSERDLGARSADAGNDEIGKLAGAFNAMADTIQLHSRELEEAVAERTRELAESNARLSATVAELQAAQGEIVESKKTAAIGQLVAGIAHQLNTPLAAISSANRFLSDSLKGQILRITKELAGIDEIDAAVLEEMLEESLASDDAVDFAMLRGKRREMASLFTEAGFADGEDLARIAIEANLHGLGSRLIEFIGNRRIRNLLSVVTAVNDIRSAGLVIDTATERAANVIRALKAYIGEGEGEMKSSVSLSASMENVLGLFRHMTGSGIALTTRFDRSAKVLGRREQLELVWMNLIDNAVRAMSGKGRLGIDIKREESLAVVTIHDTGCGIAPEMRDRIFESFLAEKAGQGRLGLGLSTAKRIIEDHGGTIAFESEAGRTIFTVTLPPEA